MKIEYGENGDITLKCSATEHALLIEALSQYKGPHFSLISFVLHLLKRPREKV